MEALGYRHNQQPFLKLAMFAPYLALEHATQRMPPEMRADAIEGWLLYLSGLVPAGYTLTVPLPRRGFGPPLAAREWHLFRVRPANHPRQRIGGAARLLARFLNQPPEQNLIGGLRHTAQFGGDKALQTTLTVAGNTREDKAYIGPERA